MLKRSNKREQASLELSRISKVCRKVQLDSSQIVSNRSLLGKNNTLDQSSYRRIFQQQQLTVSKEFQPFIQSHINKSKAHDSPLHNSSFNRSRYSLGNTDICKEASFLKSLYIKKTMDLKSLQNPKHQKIFIERLKDHINDDEFVAVQCDFGKGCIKQICEYLSTTSISKLVLNKNPIGDQGIASLNIALQNLNLTELSLVSINLSPKGCKSLIQVVSKSKTLKFFDLSSYEGLNRNRLGKQSASALQSLVKNSNSKLQSLSFENSHLSQQCFLSLCNGITKNETGKVIELRHLNVSRNDIKHNVMRNLVQKFKHVPLRSLNLSYTKIGDCEMDLISEAIGTQYSKNALSLNLRQLNVSHNNIRSFGIQSFSKQLMNNQILQEINFNDNSLFQGERFFNFKFLLLRNWAIKILHLQNTLGGLQNVKSLMEGLQGNRSIQILDISRNSLDSQSFTQIMATLPKNKSLKTLLMNTCNIADFYLNKIQIGPYASLNEISMDNNFVNEKGSKVMLRMLTKNPRIYKLSLKKNCLSLKNNKQIQQALKDNRVLAQKQQADLTYYEYVQDMHNSQKSTLINQIERLQNRKNKEILLKLACDITQKQNQIHKKQSQLNQQKKKIEALQRQYQLKGLKFPAKTQKTQLFVT